MSCRVFGRSVEDAFMAVLVEKAKAEGVKKIAIVSEETEKNLPAREFINRYFSNNERAVEMSIKAPEWVTIHI